MTNIQKIICPVCLDEITDGQPRWQVTRMVGNWPVSVPTHRHCQNDVERLDCSAGYIVPLPAQDHWQEAN